MTFIHGSLNSPGARVFGNQQGVIGFLVATSLPYSKPVERNAETLRHKVKCSTLWDFLQNVVRAVVGQVKQNKTDYNLQN